ncbi:hypothetical protein [Galbibacter sp. BG1]
MKLIDRIYRTLLVILNKESRGSLKPSDFEPLLHNAVLDLYEEKLFELNRAINRGNKGLVEGGYADISQDLRERIEHYLDSTNLNKSDTVFNLPDNYKKIDAVFTDKRRRIDVCKDSSEYNLVQDYENTKPSITYPICMKIGNNIEVKPDEIDTIKIYFLRVPKYGKWTYQNIGGKGAFDPDADDFEEVDIHVSEESQIVTRMLEKSGVNLGNYDITKIAQQLKAEEFQKEITL